MAKYSQRRSVGAPRRRHPAPAAAAPKPQTPVPGAYSGDSKVLIKLDRPAVLLEGGPRHGWAYYEDEIKRAKAATEAMGKEFEYYETNAHKVHPWTGGQKSRVWRWRGVR